MRTAAVLAAVAAPLLLRVVLLVARPLWHDERFTVWISRQSVPEIVDALAVDSGPPGFYLLEKAALSAAGRAIPVRVAARTVPFLAALALLASAGAFARRERATWVLLTSTFALVNVYSAEARAYALLGLLALLVFRLAHDGPETGRRAAGLSLAAAAALYTHYLAIFVVIAAAAMSLAQGRRRSAAACLVAFVLFAPWMPILAGQPPAATAWMRESPAATFSGLLSALGGVGRIPAPFGVAPPPILFAAGALAGVLLVVAAVDAARRDASTRAALIFVGLALGAAALVSLVRPVAFAGRWEMAVLPVWLWAVTRAAGGRRQARAVAWLAGALGLLATLRVVASPHPADTPAVAVLRVSQLARPSDALVAGPGLYLAARVASENGDLRAPVLALPERDSPHPGWFVAAAPGPAEEAEVARALDGLGPDGRLFLLLPPSYDTPGIKRTLAARGLVRELVRQPDAVLLVWRPPPGAGSR